MTEEQQSYFTQLLSNNVPAGIAERAAVALSEGLGAEDSPAIVAAYEYITSSED